MASVKYAGVAAVGLRARGRRGIDVAREDAREDAMMAERARAAALAGRVLRPVAWFGPARQYRRRVDVGVALVMTAIMAAVALGALGVLGIAVLALGGYWG